MIFIKLKQQLQIVYYPIVEHVPSEIDFELPVEI